tara:strand:+ start:16358 stop:18166 length:1809 start_codon:yes stop_codon:yes gene_type:complete
MAGYKQDVIVRYGSFQFPVPTPYVSKTFSNEFIGGDIWATKVSITLNGQVALLPKEDATTGNNYLGLQSKRDKIAKSFAGAFQKNYQNFSVTGHGTDFTLKNCTVDSVSFDSDNYVGAVGYSISISGYKNDKDFLAANYGVTNPTDTWSYSENEQGTVSVSHTVSATGYNTKNERPDGFIRAKAFVDGRKGTSKKVTSNIIQNAHPESSLILNSQSENIDRFGGSYSITENYSFVSNESSKTIEEESNLPAMQTANILLSYSISINEEQGGDFITMDLSGSVTGSKDSSVTWDSIKTDFKNRRFYDLINKAYKRHIKGGSGGSRKGGSEKNENLNKDPVSFSINPDEEARKIDFQVSFDNNQLFEKAKIKNAHSYFDYNISFDHDNITDIIDVSCSGTIRTRGSLTKKNRDNKVLLDLMLDNYSSKIRVEAQKLYYKMYPTRTQYSLAPRPHSISVTQNEFDGSIQYQASFSDKDYPENSQLRDLSYNLSIVPSTQQYKSVPSCLENGHYLVYDLNLTSKREAVTINTSATADERDEASYVAARGEAKSINDILKNSFLDGDVIRLESQNKVENRDQSSITYNRGFSQEKGITTIKLDRLDN